MQSKQAMSFMKWFAKTNNINFKVVNEFSDEWCGRYFCGTNKIEISKPYLKESKINEVLSTFFHECMHVRCYREQIYPLSHNTPKDTRKHRMQRRSQAKRAEQHVDRMAKKEMKSWFPDLKFQGSYIGPGSKLNLEYLLEMV